MYAQALITAKETPETLLGPQTLSVVQAFCSGHVQAAYLWYAVHLGAHCISGPGWQHKDGLRTEWKLKRT